MQNGWSWATSMMWMISLVWKLSYKTGNSLGCETSCKSISSSPIMLPFWKKTINSSRPNHIKYVNRCNCNLQRVISFMLKFTISTLIYFNFDRKLLNHVADVIYFGPLNDCKECKTGKLVFNGNDSYLCNGTISSYAKCTNNVKMPPRRSFEIPKKVDAAFFKTKFRTKQRAIKLPTGLIKS